MGGRRLLLWKPAVLGLAGLLALSACGAVKVEKTGKGVGIPDPGGFEQEEPGALPPGWGISGSHAVRLELDEEISRSGKPSIRLSSRVEESATAIHRVESRQKAEGMVQIRASLKVSKGVARMWARLLSGEEYSLAFTPKIRGPRDWQEHTLLLFAPAGEEEISVFLEIEGPGTLWADDLSIKELDIGGSASDGFTPLTLPNLDAEVADGKGGIERWSVSRASEPGAELRADRETFHSGSQSARIRWTVPEKDADGVAIAEYCTPAEPFINRLVRLSGWLRTDADYGSMRISAYFDAANRDVYGEHNGGGAYAEEEPDRSSGWTLHEVTTPVPPGTRLVCFEFGLDYTSGTIWWDDFRVETRDL